MDALVRRCEPTLRYLDYEPGMHPIGAQLCGSKPELAAPCAKMIEDMGFDVIDLNCGCPVDKVTKDGSGSGLLKRPELIGEILSNMIAAVRIPVTVKVRAGWDSQSINAHEITQIAEAAGAAAICIHGRTRAQGYAGPANWDYIKECKRVAKRIKVIGNGDVFDAQSAKNIFEYTGCDAILLARGTMGQPWLIEDIYRFFSDLPVEKKSPLYVKRALLEHYEAILAYQPIERKVITDMRRVGCWYLKNGKGMKRLRELINHSTSAQEIRTLIEQYPWENCFEADHS